MSHISRLRHLNSRWSVNSLHQCTQHNGLFSLFSFFFNIIYHVKRYNGVYSPTSKSLILQFTVNWNIRNVGNPEAQRHITNDRNYRIHSMKISKLTLFCMYRNSSASLNGWRFLLSNIVLVSLEYRKRGPYVYAVCYSHLTTNLVN